MHVEASALRHRRISSLFSTCRLPDLIHLPCTGFPKDLYSDHHKYHLAENSSLETRCCHVIGQFSQSFLELTWSLNSHNQRTSTQVNPGFPGHTCKTKKLTLGVCTPLYSTHLLIHALVVDWVLSIASSCCLHGLPPDSPCSTLIGTNSQ